MPDPRSGETEEQFVERCVPVVIEDGTAEDEEQAVAVCHSMWRQAQQQDDGEEDGKTYECECLDCGHEFTSEGVHCDKAECPSCGSDNCRRAERPGAGQPSDNWLRVAANQLANVRHHSLDGTDYLVAPVVLIREGVLNGELVKAAEFAKHYESWNGRPFVVGHPRDVEGNAVTANHPLTLAGLNQGVQGGLKVGTLYNTTPLNGDGDGREGLRSEIWLPVEQVRRKGGMALDVLARLQKKERLEVSTAYWRDFEPRIGEWNGQPYDGVALNLKPDHVAALLDTVGACSWTDGCGAPRLNEEGCMAENVLKSARRPKWSSKSSDKWSAPSLSDFGIDKDVADMSQDEKARVAGHSLLGDPDADDFRELCFFPVVSPSGALNEHALMAVISGRGSQANIPAEAKASAQRMARRLLNSEFDRDLEVEEALDFLQQLAKFARVVANKLGLRDPQVNDEDEEAPMDREGLIAELLANTDFDEEDLKALSDCGLQALAELVKQPEVEDVPEPEPVPEPELETQEDEDEGDVEPEPEPEQNEDEPEYVPRGEYEALFEKLAKMGERVEAVEAELQRNETERKAELVKALAANDKCALSEAQLEKMDTDALEALQQSFVPADYSGAGGGPQVQEEREWVIYTRPIKEVDNG